MTVVNVEEVVRVVVNLVVVVVPVAVVWIIDDVVVGITVVGVNVDRVVVAFRKTSFIIKQGLFKT